MVGLTISACHRLAFQETLGVLIEWCLMLLKRSSDASKRRWYTRLKHQREHRFLGMKIHHY
jgi:hypothetical protein